MEQFCYLSDMSKKYNMNSVVDTSHSLWLWGGKRMKCQIAMRFSYFKLFYFKSSDYFQQYGCNASSQVH